MTSGAVHTVESVSYTHLDVYKRQVDGQEQQIGAGGLGTSQLDVEVGLAGLGEGALIDDVHTAGIGLCLEVVPDTDGVLVIVFVDDGDLRTVEVLIDVLGGTGALVGVCLLYTSRCV